MLYKFENLASARGIKHFVSTRKNGVSQGRYTSFNLALHVGDKEENVLSNRAALAKALELRPSEFVFVKQAHSDRAKIVVGKHRGRGAKEHCDGICNADALITKTPGTCVVVQVADCVPVLLFDPVKKVIAAVHAGWRGTMKEIARKTVEMMKQEFDCDPQDMIGGIGPSIGPCCFEVQKNVFHLANIIYSAREAVVIKRREKTFINLWQANKIQLQRAGLLESNIELTELCTACETEEFFSARKEGKTGRFVCGIALKK